MAQAVERLVVDCSVVVKWKVPAEPYAAEADALLHRWEEQAVELCAPNVLQAKVMSAFLRAHRRGRIGGAEATQAIRDLLALPFRFYEVAPIAVRAFEIAQQYHQRSYDSVYVALAEREGIILWTGDERLYNALQPHLDLVRWIGDYQPETPR